MKYIVVVFFCYSLLGTAARSARLFATTGGSSGSREGRPLLPLQDPSQSSDFEFASQETEPAERVSYWLSNLPLQKCYTGSFTGRIEEGNLNMRISCEPDLELDECSLKQIQSDHIKSLQLNAGLDVPYHFCHREDGKIRFTVNFCPQEDEQTCAFVERSVNEMRQLSKKLVSNLQALDSQPDKCRVLPLWGIALDNWSERIMSIQARGSAMAEKYNGSDSVCVCIELGNNDSIDYLTGAVLGKFSLITTHFRSYMDKVLGRPFLPRSYTDLTLRDLPKDVLDSTWYEARIGQNCAIDFGRKVFYQIPHFQCIALRYPSFYNQRVVDAKEDLSFSPAHWLSGITFEKESSANWFVTQETNHVWFGMKRKLEVSKKGKKRKLEVDKTEYKVAETEETKNIEWLEVHQSVPKNHLPLGSDQIIDSDATWFVLTLKPVEEEDLLSLTERGLDKTRFFINTVTRLLRDRDHRPIHFPIWKISWLYEDEEGWLGIRASDEGNKVCKLYNGSDCPLIAIQFKRGDTLESLLDVSQFCIYRRINEIFMSCMRQIFLRQSEACLTELQALGTAALPASILESDWYKKCVAPLLVGLKNKVVIKIPIYQARALTKVRQYMSRSRGLKNTQY